MNFIKNLLKTIAAGVVAVGILSVIFSFYYLQPAHIDNTEGNTDYVWVPSARWFKMTEGISWGRFDAKGYNNPEVVENPDIIVLGSSHTEATNVVQGKDFSSLLRDKLEGQYSVYNMGISGHNFLKVCHYLEQNLKKFDTPPKAVIIATSALTFSYEDVVTLLEGRTEKSPSYNTGLIAMSQKSPFFALMYNQVQGGLVDLLMPDKEKLMGIFAAEPVTPPLSYFHAATPVKLKPAMRKLLEVYQPLFDNLSALQQQYGTQIIIMLHPTGNLHADNSPVFIREDINIFFYNLCVEKGICFVDMTDTFRKNYETEHKLPHGFVTGKAGHGHLNSYGHAVIADALYDTIVKLSGEGRI